MIPLSRNCRTIRMRMGGIYSRSKRRPHRFGRLEPTPRRVCAPANTPARTCDGGAPDALLLRHWNSQKSVKQCSVRKKSLYTGDTSDMNLALESGQAGRSSTSSMNGRSWLQMPMGAYLAQNGSARPIGFALFSTYAEDEWFQHRFIHGIGVADFCGFRGAAESRFSAYFWRIAQMSGLWDA